MSRIFSLFGVVVIAFVVVTLVSSTTTMTMAVATPSSSIPKQKKQKLFHLNNNNNDLADCDSASYQKSTLTLLSSQKFASIPGFLRSGHMRQFEGSGVSVGPTGRVAVVFDNSHALGVLGAPSAAAAAGSPLAIGVGELAGDRGGSQSGWEGVAWRHDAPAKGGGASAATILALREAVEVPADVAAAAAVDDGDGGVDEKERGKFDGDGDGDAALGWAPPGFPSSSAPRGNISDIDLKRSKVGAAADDDDDDRKKREEEEGGGKNKKKNKKKRGEKDEKIKNKKEEKEQKKKKKKKVRRPENENPLFAVVDELALPEIAGESPKLLRSCPVDFELTHENKGLEDIYYLGGGRAIALCEGNYCEGGTRGREAGNGRLLVLRFDDGGSASGGSEEEEEEKKAAEEEEQHEGKEGKEKKKEKRGLLRRRRLHLGPPSHKHRPPRRSGSVVFVGGQRAADAAATARSGGDNGSGGNGTGGPRRVVSGAAAAAAAASQQSSSPSSPSSSPPPPQKKNKPLFAARCAWRVESVVDLPRDALFEDYSGLALRGGLAAVLSQVDSAVFVSGFDVDSLRFDPVPKEKRYGRRVFGLPRSNTCQEHSFCTAEGIDLLDDPLVRGVVRVLVATDKAAAGSPWACVHTAEAIHVMSLPKHALPQAPDDDDDEEGEKEGKKNNF